MANEDLIQCYEDARRRYENRIKSWVTKFHAIIKPIPRVKHTKNITEKSIERLEKVIWPKVSKRRKKEAHKEYEIQYESRNPDVYTPKPPYKPPTESDFYNNNIPEVPQTSPHSPEEPDEEPDEDGYTETVKSREEIDAWIHQYIDPIDVELMGDNIHELDGSRDTIENLIHEASDAYGDYDFYYNYLEENAGKIVELATRAMMGYIGYKGVLYQSFPEAMPELATLLNLGRPLEVSQSERLQDEGWVSYDFNNL